MTKMTPLTYFLLIALGAVCVLINGGVDARLFFFRSTPSASTVESQKDSKWTHYHDQEAMEAKLVEIHKKCPNITSLYSVGKSLEGRDLAVIQFSTTAGQHKALKPEMKFVGNMHGNEVVGRELLIRLADFLCESWRTGDNHEMVEMLNRTSIHLMPTMNPDGFELAYRAKPEERGWLLGRGNAHGRDLNRNFPDLDKLYYLMENRKMPFYDHLLEMFRDAHAYEPEVRAVGEWILALPFVLSANLHEGDLVANYPFDESRVEGQVTQAYSQSPDDATFRFLAESYANNHAHMAKNDHAPCDGTAASNFARQGGVTNGAKWYSVSGGMQDFNYLASNAFEITLELSCEKFPAAETLPTYWKDNKKSLLDFIKKTHLGIKGLVEDVQTGKPIANAVITVRNVTGGKIGGAIKHPVTTWTTGDYFRPLVPGSYQVAVEVEGYEPAVKAVNVTHGSVISGHAAILNFKLKPLTESAAISAAEKSKYYVAEPSAQAVDEEPEVRFATPQDIRQQQFLKQTELERQQQQQRNVIEEEDGQYPEISPLAARQAEEYLRLMKIQEMIAAQQHQQPQQHQGYVY